MPHEFVRVNQFTPDNRDWSTFGDVTGFTQNGATVDINSSRPGFRLRIDFLSAEAYRFRFRPVASPNYNVHRSYALPLAPPPGPTPVVTDSGDHLQIDTGSITLRVDKSPYRLRVFRGDQLISNDEPSYNLVFIPGAEVTAYFKTFPANARFCGFGEKAGETLFKNNCTMTFFNFDNYAFNRFGRQGPDGPRDPAIPLYCSIPLLIESNPQPVDAFAGQPYCNAMLLDNPGQTFMNIGRSDYSNMFGKYYFGALYEELDCYFMFGTDVGSVLEQYTDLTGRSPMPPKYVFGYHQGAYGYYERPILERIAADHRAARVPIDGLHIDIDFQDNYRVFTTSVTKFPSADIMLAGLRENGFKCSTNITAILTTDARVEGGQSAPYAALQALRAVPGSGLVKDQSEGGGGSGGEFEGPVFYGTNPGLNPYPSPGRRPDANGHTRFDVRGCYPEICRDDVQQAWGAQYQHLVQALGLEMIWQDMMCPALDLEQSFKTIPLDLLQDRGDGVKLPHAKIHNAYGQNMLKATWNGVTRLREAARQAAGGSAGSELRTFIVARGGYAGMQRFAALWTGDAPSGRDYLKTYIPQVLNIGLSGVPLSGADIGGFANGMDSVPDAFQRPGPVRGGITHYVVFVRWMQIGAFLPWFRNHYNGYTKQFQEIHRYAEPVTSICRAVIELRYRLVQLFYDMMYKWTQTGLPICRPLFLNDPHDLGAYDHVDDQFFVGRDLLVAPIVPSLGPEGRDEVAVRQVYLPAGSDWYSFKDNRSPLEQAVAGGTLIRDWRARLDQIPMYVRAGAVIPTRELEQYVGELSLNPITLNAYPGGNGEYTLYEDDGVTRNAELNGAFRVTDIRHTTIGRVRRVQLTRGQDGFSPPERFLFIAVLSTGRPASVTRDGFAIADVGTPESLSAATGDAFYWNQSLNITFVKIFIAGASTSVEVTS